MPTLLDRISTASRDFVRRVSTSATSTPRTTLPTLTRWTDYQLRDQFYSGAIYRPNTQGGGLRDVLRLIGRPSNLADEAKYPIRGYYNPVTPIVDFYANALGGRLGSDDLDIADEVNGRQVNAAMREVVRRVWRWSNLDAKLVDLTHTAANQGTCGIRIVEIPGRVYLDFDDPRWIESVQLDERGNVRFVLLKYAIPTFGSDGKESGTEDVEEVLSTEGFSYKIAGIEQLTPDQQRNDLGLCPYVLLQHRSEPGQLFGRHAYFGSENAIHAINYGLSQLDESIHAHVWPYIFAHAPGKKPTKITTGRYTMVYVQTREANGPPPGMETLVPDLDFSGALEHLRELVNFVRDRQPQTVLNSLSLLSGISGETLAQVLKPAEAESRRARGLYEDAVVRAIQIATSLGIFRRMDGFDLGTGTGSQDAANRAYDDGTGPEAFAFKDRPALPPTVYQRQQQAAANVAEQSAKFGLANAAKSWVSTREGLRLAGYTDRQIAVIEAEKAAQDVLPDEEQEVAA